MSPAPMPLSNSPQAPSHPTPSLFAHAVLRTTPANYQPMIAFYARLLNATIVHTNATITFLRFDSEHHRIAILQTPDVRPKPADGTLHAGLDHLAFTYASLADLARVYVSLRTERGEEAVQPIWAVNHGPTTSLYYRDPDGNKVELQVDNFESPEAADAFMTGELFARNPIGTDFDAEAWAGEVLASAGEGVDVELERKLKVRREIGERGEVPEGF